MTFNSDNTKQHKYLTRGIKKKNLEKVEAKYYDGPALIETKKWSPKEPLIHLEASFKKFPMKKLAMIFILKKKEKHHFEAVPCIVTVINPK